MKWNTMRLINSVLVSVFFPLITESAKILFVALSAANSHQIVFQAVWRELSLKGHEVTVITPNPLNDATLTNLTEIDLSSIYKDKPVKLTLEEKKYLLKKPDFFTAFFKDSIATRLFSKANKFVFEHENVKKFLEETRNQQFDVCVIEWIFPTMVALGFKYNCPVIGITSLGAPIPALDSVGNPSHPAFNPDHNLPLSIEMTFKERLMSTLYAVYVRVYYHLVVLPRENNLIEKYLGKGLPYLGDMERNISLLLLNKNIVFHRIMPTVPAIIEIGGIRINKSNDQDLNSELKNFLGNSKNGVIYISFGTIASVELLSEDELNIFIETFKELPYDIVWKWKGEFPNKPKNIFTQEWLPQEKLLEHINVKLFITQGGQQSSEEAIKNHVPIIGIPFWSDQTTNVATCVKYGMGIWLDLENLTIDNLNSSIHEIIKNPSYKENASKLDKYMKDQPFDGLQRTVWWIEYVIRHKGAKHLRSPTLDLSWPDYFMIDVLSILISVLGLSIFIVYKLIRLVFRSVLKKLIVRDKSIKQKIN